MAEGKLEVQPLISHRYSFDEALKAYETVSGGGALGIVLNYERLAEDDGQVSVDRGGGGGKFAQTVKVAEPTRVATGTPVVAFVGAGGFTTRMLLPALKGVDCRLKTIVSGTGVSGTHAAGKFGFEETSTDSDSVFADKEINTVFITTQHNTHAASSAKGSLPETRLC